MSKPRRAPRRPVDGVLLLDKPRGLTSNAALQKVRWLFNAEKAGHTGTLDPLATGLLPLCFGDATKFAGELLGADKTYRAELRLGVTTDTGDAEGQVLKIRPVEVARDQLLEAMQCFRGEIDQIPPMYSALKRNGRPLYEYARAGIELEREARRITIYGLDLLDFTDDRVILDVDCSKGTYIRTLAVDLGERLGCGAHLTALRRTRIGAFKLTEAVALDMLEALDLTGRDRCLAPVDSLLCTLPEARLNSVEFSRVSHGQGIRWNSRAGEAWRLYGPEGTFLGLGRLSDDGWLIPRRLVSAQGK
ncbi:MAG: tRNA pseudouridine(55) synthase TruB [Proteobacteria bacterium]|nr:tRNA pseudouridine(55) synthase TruB [Pseudomonadota bacterium]HQR02609.1 tRNA pseudouridine(55) synthase TruB [Rhodocyclaceae bacterium]